ncbi:MAG: aldehyde dehydrogenase family protein [Anaerolineales bacterium]|nr:aldehyde dehydrogenase family protein [Anaerolineales bacterium]
MEAERELMFVNPATGAAFGRVAMTTPEAVCEAMAEMRAAAGVWGRKTPAERVAVLRRFQEVLIDARDEISDVINQDCGKSRQDALIEVFMTVDLLNEYNHHAPGWLRVQEVSRGLYVFKRCLVERRPYGVVAVISPWNYPFALAMPPLIAALLAGNTVVLKPSEVTAATGVLIDRLVQRVPELAPYVRVIHGDGRVGAALVAARPDFIFLTGSTPTGKKVMAAAAEHLIPVTCELGGKDPLIVLEDADVDAAAKWAVWGAYFNTGQTCMAVERVYVVDAVYDEFVRAAVHYTQELTVGYRPEIDNPHYLGPMTDPRQIQIVQRHFDEALAQGARVLTGGGFQGMFIEPTVMVDVTHSMALMQDETFGPILPIMRVQDEAEAIALANDNRFGLGASVWSRDMERARRVAGALQTGSVLINDTICQFAVPQLPFGGMKESGIGRVHGREGLMQFTQPRAVVEGAPPLEWDIATVFRKPGHYQAIGAVMRLVFGVTPRQRLEPVQEVLAGERIPLSVPMSGLKLDRRLAAAALAAAGGVALAGFAWARRRPKA